MYRPSITITCEFLGDGKQRHYLANVITATSIIAHITYDTINNYRVTKSTKLINHKYKSP